MKCISAEIHTVKTDTYVEALLQFGIPLHRFGHCIVVQLVEEHYSPALEGNSNRRYSGTRRNKTHCVEHALFRIVNHELVFMIYGLRGNVRGNADLPVLGIVLSEHRSESKSIRNCANTIVDVAERRLEEGR